MIETLRVFDFAKDAGFLVDDGDGLTIQPQEQLEQLANATTIDGAGDKAAEVGWLWTTIATGCIQLISVLGQTPWWARVAIAVVQLGAALLAWRGQRLRQSASVLLCFSLFGAAHVLLSALAMYVLGAVIFLSELMAKRLALVGGVALWSAHCGAGDGGAGVLELLPLHGTASSARKAGADSGAEKGRAGGVRLLAGRVTIAIILAFVCGTELWRLLCTQLTSPVAVCHAYGSCGAARTLCCNFLHTPPTCPFLIT